MYLASAGVASPFELLLSVSLLVESVIVPSASTPMDAALFRVRYWLLRSRGGEFERDSGGENIPSPERAKLPSEGEVKCIGNLGELSFEESELLGSEGGVGRWLEGDFRTSGWRD